MSSRKEYLQGVSDSAQKERIANMELEAERLKERNLRLEKDLADRFAPRALTSQQVQHLSSTFAELKGTQIEIWSVPDWEASRFADAFRRLAIQYRLIATPVEIVNGAAIGIGIVTPINEEVSAAARAIAKSFRAAGIDYYTLKSDLVSSGRLALAFGQKPEEPIEGKPTY